MQALQAACREPGGGGGGGGGTITDPTRAALNA